MKFKLTENKKNLICYNTKTGVQQNNLYLPEIFRIHDYIIHDDGTLSVNTSVELYDRDLYHLPFEFKYVNGMFDCSNNYLTTLKGSPRYVNGALYCYKNNLTTLEGSPDVVAYNFVCYRNKLTSFKGISNPVFGHIESSRNNITDYSHLPSVHNTIGHEYSTFYQNTLELEDIRTLKFIGYFFTNN